MNEILELAKALCKITGLEAKDLHMVLQESEEMYCGELILADRSINFELKYFIYEDGTIEKINKNRL